MKKSLAHGAGGLILMTFVSETHSTYFLFLVIYAVDAVFKLLNCYKE